MTTWSVVTGKMLEQHKLKQVIDFKKYSVYQCEPADETYKREWYQPHCLLKCSDSVAVNEDEYFDEKFMKTSLDNNTAYLKIVQKVFHELKMIEIKNEREVIEHFSFVHPEYNDGNY